MSENNQIDTKTNVVDFISELNAGILINQLGLTLSEAALATVLHAKGNQKGKVTLELSMAQLGENEQVVITSKLTKSVPTKRGKKYEENITDTPFFVGKGGVLTIDAPKVDNNEQFQLNHETDGKVRKINS